MHEEFIQNIKEFIQNIKDANKLLELEDDWDENGGKKVNKYSLVSVECFLYGFVEETKKEILIPEINPLMNGGIDVCFRNENNGYRFLICFGTKRISWYGDNGSDEDKIKGSTSKFFFMINPEYYKILEYVKSHFEKIIFNDTNPTGSI